MAKVSKENKETKKWGAMFEGEELVEIHIPFDELNPVNAKWYCINGQEIWLAVGEDLIVPKSIADLYKHSVRCDREAKQRMSKFEEMK